MTSGGRQRAADVVMIGGGVMGYTIAYELAIRGVSVTVVEQREVAASASGASAGGVRQQGRDLREPPLALRAIPRWPGLADRLGVDVEYRRGGHLTLIEDETILPPSPHPSRGSRRRGWISRSSSRVTLNRSSGNEVTPRPG